MVPRWWRIRSLWAEPVGWLTWCVCWGWTSERASLDVWFVMECLDVGLGGHEVFVPGLMCATHLHAKLQTQQVMRYARIHTHTHIHTHKYKHPQHAHTHKYTPTPAPTHPHHTHTTHTHTCTHIYTHPHPHLHPHPHTHPHHKHAQHTHICPHKHKCTRTPGRAHRSTPATSKAATTVL